MNTDTQVDVKPQQRKFAGTLRDCERRDAP